MAAARRLEPCLWIAYIVVPVHRWGLLDGRPLGLLETAALALVAWLWFTRGRLPLARTVAVALALKVTAGAFLLLPAGLEGRYYANEVFEGSPEPSVEPGRRAGTRIDDRIRFGGDAPDLPLEFFNDDRFNFYQPGQPDRATLPFSVTWQGVLRIARPGAHRYYVRASDGATAELKIGDAVALRASAAAGVAAGEAVLDGGFQPVSITLSVPQGGGRAFEAGETVDGRDVPFDNRVVFDRPASAAALAADRAVTVFSRMLDLAMCLWLAAVFLGEIRRIIRRIGAAFQPRDVLAVFWAVAVADALVFALPSLGRLVVLSGGDDWFTYETAARDIALNGVWMRGGAELGHGRPFYYQPLYPYFLAACHWLFGGGLFGVLFVQRCLAGLAAVSMWRTTATLFGESIGRAGLIAGVIVVYAKLAAWSGVLLTETLFVPLVCASLLLVVRLAVDRRSGPRTAVAAGVVGGLATLARSTLILGWLAAVPALALGGSRRRWTMAAILVATLGGVTSLATVRNWIVARELVPITTSGSVNLFIGNQPRTPISIAPDRKAAYGRLGLDAYTQIVVEYVRQQPRAFLAGLGRKALYALGFFDALLPGSGWSAFYVCVWLLSIAGVLCARTAAPDASRIATMIPLLFAAAHFASIVAVFPHVYGDRLVMPFYVLLVPYVAVAIAAALRWRPSIDREVWRTAALGALALTGAVWSIAPQRVGLDLSLVAVGAAMTAWALSEESTRETRVVLWPFAGLALSLAVAFVARPSPAAALEYRRALAFLVLVPAAASLAGAARARALATVLLLASGVAAVWGLVSTGWSPLVRASLAAAIRPGVTVFLVGAIVGIALVALAMFGRRAAWRSAALALAGAMAMIALAAGPVWSRVALDTAWLRAHGWATAGEALAQHPWLGAGLAWPGAMPDGPRFEASGIVLWLLLTAGPASALFYLIIWWRALSRSGAAILDWRAAALAGMALGAFTGAQYANVVAGSAAAPGIVLAFALVAGIAESSHVPGTSRADRAARAAQLAVLAIGAGLAALMLVPKAAALAPSEVAAALQEARQLNQPSVAADIANGIVRRQTGGAAASSDVLETALRARRFAGLKDYFDRRIRGSGRLDGATEMLVLARAARLDGWSQMPALYHSRAEAWSRQAFAADTALLDLAVDGRPAGIAQELFSDGARLDDPRTPLAVFKGWRARDAGGGQCDLLIFFTPTSSLSGSRVWLHAYPRNSRDYADVGAVLPAGDWSAGELGWEVFRLAGASGTVLFAGVAEGGDLGPAIRLGSLAGCAAGR